MQGGDWRLDPDLTAYVSGVGRKLAATSARPNLPYEFVILNNSVPNAWALPGGKIAINHGLLLELDNEAQLAAVMAHEIVHAAARHGAQQMERGILLQGVVAAAAIGTHGSRYADLAVGSAALGAQLISRKYGRDAEAEADRYGMQNMLRAGYDPRAAVALHETFVRLSNDKHPNWLEGLFASHPPSQDRVEANRRTAAELLAGSNTGGDVFLDRWQRATARLRASRDAYAAHDLAREQLAQQALSAALASIETAISAEPNESRFHALHGAIHHAQHRYRDAIASYDLAIQLDKSWFANYVGRGLARKSAGNRGGARRDFDHSLDLLPTSVAHYELGRLAEARGEPEAAISHYAAIASTQSEHSEAAAHSLARIQLPRQPGRYLHVRVAVNTSRFVSFEIENRSPFAVHQLEVEITRRDTAGAVVSTRRVALQETLQPGGLLRKQTDIGPIHSDQQLRAFAIVVVQALPAK